MGAALDWIQACTSFQVFKPVLCNIHIIPTESLKQISALYINALYQPSH